MINEKDPLVQLQKTRPALGYNIKNILGSMKGIKFIETLKVTFEKISGDEVKSRAAYFNSMAQTVINKTEIAELLQLSAEQILNMDIRGLRMGHYINQQPLPTQGSSYLNLPLELQHHRKG